MYRACVMNASEMYHRCNILTESPRAIFIEKSKDLSRKIEENILRCQNLHLKCIMNV